MRYTMSPLVLLAGLAVALLAADVGAQEVRDRIESRQDRQDLRQDRLQLGDDRRDLGRLGQLVTSFETARKNNDASRLRAIDAEVQRLLVDEMAESNRELELKQREVRQDRRELRSDQLEVRDDRQLQAAIGVRVDDQHDRQDDRRDLRDDRRDVGAEQAQGRGIAAIIGEWTQLMGHQDAASLTRKRALLAEVQAMNRHELRGDVQERSEDRGEKREDRRETHEDRVQDRK